MDRLDNDDDDSGDDNNEDETGRREDGETESATCEDAEVEASSTDDDAKATTPLEFAVGEDIIDPNVEDAVFHDCARKSRSRSCASSRKIIPCNLSCKRPSGCTRICCCCC